MPSTQGRARALPEGYGATQTSGEAAETGSEASNDLNTLGPVLSSLEERGLFRSDSMDMTNDPRFFQGSVLSKRLDAFSGLGVVSSLMVGFFEGKVLDYHVADVLTVCGALHTSAYFLSLFSLFGNLLALYVSVAQIYHVHRLETAGPIGFEMATGYYLNPNVVAWRHMAIKFMLLSLPMMLVSTGVILEVHQFIGWDGRHARAEQTKEARPDGKAHLVEIVLRHCIGSVSLALCACMAAVLLHVHNMHCSIFQEKYSTVTKSISRHVQQVHAQSRKSLAASGSLDV
eukprot:TRINITY_DN7966_c0_g1_i1.p1 TRINITY_DN7966_c0_g1~~TRINITY_DN7966_c0_g1_i1.p1  ORF type:complete len:287 (-),score=46.24 TRINITY_DN7966_c0_g1_i1:88-948(-)